MATFVNKKHVFFRFYKHWVSVSTHFCNVDVRYYARGLKRTPINIYTTQEAEELQGSSSKVRPLTKRVPASQEQVSKNYDIPYDVSFKQEKLAHSGSRKKHSESSSRIWPNKDELNSFSSSVVESSFGFVADESQNDLASKKKRKKTTVSDNTREDEDIEVNIKEHVKPLYPYVRLEQGDKLFSSAVIQAKGKQEKYKSILLEGVKLINDALEAGVNIKMVFFDTVSTLNKLTVGEEYKNIKFFKVRTSRIRILSDMSNPPGVMAIAQQPNNDMQQRDASPLILILDGVKDPGDMGTLIRTAAVAGCELVIATKGCVDVWNGKVLRAGAGAHFRIPIINDIGWQYIGNYLPSKTYVSLTHRYIEKFNRRASAFRDITESRAFYEEQNKYVHIDEDGKRLTQDLSFSKDNAKLYDRIPLPRVSLFEMDIGAHDHVTCVVSGEAKGAAGAAKKLVYENGGEEVYVPNSDVSALGMNTAVAGCIILTEAKRQLYKKGLIPDVRETTTAEMQENGDFEDSYESDAAEPV